jgi:hypothetical protein
MVTQAKGEEKEEFKKYRQHEKFVMSMYFIFIIKRIKRPLINQYLLYSENMMCIL